MKSRGGRRGSGGTSRQGGEERGRRGPARPVPQPAAHDGASRIKLTHILREGVIWNVFVTTTAGQAAAAAVLLEFERTGGDGLMDRYSTPLTGRLRDALYGGGSVSKADLLHELQLAIESAAASREAPAATESEQ
jgi:hypothetical protein